MTSNSVLVNVVVFGIGNVTGWLIATYLWTHPAVLQHRENRKARLMNRTHDQRRRRDFYGIVIIVFLVALALIALQMYQAQGAQDDRDAARAETQKDLAAYAECMSAWGEDLVSTVRTRYSATKAENKAKAQRDKAMDDIVLTVVAARRVPPEATSADFTRVLAQYVKALRNKARVEAEANATRERNPYPKPQCVVPTVDKGEEK